jgi:hypothetical protein
MTEHDFQVNIVATLKRLNYGVYSFQNAQTFMSIIRSLLYKIYKVSKLVKFHENRYFFMIMSSLKKAGFHSGASDLVVTSKGKVYFVEIKTPTEYKTSEKTGKRIISKAGGKQSTEQKKFQAEIEAEGLPYVLIDSWEKFENFLKEVKK